MALRPIHGRAVWARAPAQRRPRGASCPGSPASISPPVGSPRIATSPARGRAGRANRWPSPLCSARHLLAGVEDARDVDGRVGARAAASVEHHGEAALHVGRAQAPQHVALDARRGRCRWPERCRCDRPAPPAWPDPAAVRATRLSPTRSTARCGEGPEARSRRWSVSAASWWLSDGMSTSAAVSVEQVGHGPRLRSRAATSGTALAARYGCPHTVTAYRLPSTARRLGRRAGHHHRRRPGARHLVPLPRARPDDAAAAASDLGAVTSRATRLDRTPPAAAAADVAGRSDPTPLRGVERASPCAPPSPIAGRPAGRRPRRLPAPAPAVAPPRTPPTAINLDGALRRCCTTSSGPSSGPCAVDDFEPRPAWRCAPPGAPLQVPRLDKFPRMTDYVVPTGVRIADADRVRLGAHLAEGTTVMHEGFVNFNAGTLGTAMVEGRISAGRRRRRRLRHRRRRVDHGHAVRRRQGGHPHRRALPARRQRRHRHLARRRLRRRGRPLRHRRHPGDPARRHRGQGRRAERAGRASSSAATAPPAPVEVLPRAGGTVELNAALHGND